MPTPLYTALSTNSGGFLNQSTQRPTVGPPASAGVGPASGGPDSPMSPNGDNMFAPMSEPEGLPPAYRDNPVVTQYDINGSPAMPSPEIEHSPDMPGQSLYRSLQDTPELKDKLVMSMISRALPQNPELNPQGAAQTQQAPSFHRQFIGGEK